ncbi:uncharacterized protein LOC127240543 [Andrographis paniculata]|uniref:uncharacterized protein LOC127240543 n=1 Tax=Andrographis paniculata TaxID=175694 RepID=UPI0021E7D0BD|nr:uncharacterized protein LOC127240543 [Andrographis paniculata]
MAANYSSWLESNRPEPSRGLYQVPASVSHDARIDSLSIQVKELSKLMKQDLRNKGKQALHEAAECEESAFVDQQGPQVAECSTEVAQNPAEVYYMAGRNAPQFQQFQKGQAQGPAGPRPQQQFQRPQQFAAQQYHQGGPSTAESGGTLEEHRDEISQIPVEEEGQSQPRAIPAAWVPEPKEKGPTQPLALAPFPTRLGKKDNSKEFDKFMPHYAKFIKHIINRKRAFPDEAAAVQLESVCSAVFKKDLPKKLRDPGSFIIICTIGNLEPIRALCDLGASINLMPFSLFSKLGLYELEVCRTVIQLADKLIRLPKGIIHDVLVQVNKFIFPTDFIIMEISEDREIPIILGRPFLATTQATINVDKGEISLSFGGDKVTFSMNSALSQPQEENCDFINELNELTTFESYITLENLEAILDNGSLELEDEEDLGEASDEILALTESIERATREPESDTNIKDELKKLPEHLKYIFLGLEESYPLIISASLLLDQEAQLVSLLKRRKTAFA